MTLMRRILLIALAAWLLTGFVCSAQSPPPMAATPVRKVGKAEVFYFKNSDTSKVNVGVTLLGSHETILREDYFSLGVSFSVHGQKVTRPNAVILDLYSYTHGTDYRYRNDNQVSISIDGKPLVSGRAHESFLAIDPRGGVTESYFVSMSFDDFVKILKSNVVTLKFGNTPFDLKREHLETLSDLNRAIE
jgi:hypothetical protein